jgi:hypothetical protein
VPTQADITLPLAISTIAIIIAVIAAILTVGLLRKRA